MRLAALLLLLAPAAVIPMHGQAKTEIPADIIIPQPPPSAPLAAWKDAPGRTTVHTTAADGIELRGFRYPGSDGSAPEVLFFNGNGMTILRTDAYYRALAAVGPTVTVYDYRGYGFSSGDAHLASFRTDGLLLYDKLRDAAPGHRLVVFGASMGTATAAYIAQQRPVTGLVLGMPIASAEEEFPVYGRLLGYTPQMLAGLTPAPEGSAIFGETALVKQSKAPLLVLGGSADRVVPVNQAREIFAESPATDKHFVEVPGAGHNDVIEAPQSMKALSAFLENLH